MAQRRILITAGAVLIGLVIVVAIVASNGTPTVPAGAGSVAITRTSPPSPTAGNCLDRIERPGSWLDLCWQAYRDESDEDPDKDYYVLRVYGTLSGEPGGVRWSVVRADLVGQVPADGVFEAWPDGQFDGPCRVVRANVTFDPTVVADETVCGLTIGASSGAPWSHAVTWTCVGCFLPDKTEHEVALYESVGVPQGTVPEWTIGADFGS